MPAIDTVSMQIKMTPPNPSRPAKEQLKKEDLDSGGQLVTERRQRILGLSELCLPSPWHVDLSLGYIPYSAK
jgi:hypothetical protein